MLNEVSNISEWGKKTIVTGATPVSMFLPPLSLVGWWIIVVGLLLCVFTVLLFHVFGVFPSL